MQEQIRGAFRSCGCKEYENDRGSSLLSAKVCETNEKSYELLCKLFSAVPERTKEELESLLGRNFMGYVSGTSVTLKDRNREDQPLQITIQLTRMMKSTE